MLTHFNVSFLSAYVCTTVDRESTESILFHTEKEAIRFFNMQKISKAVQWYEALVNIGLRHGTPIFPLLLLSR